MDDTSDRNQHLLFVTVTDEEIKLSTLLGLPSTRCTIKPQDHKNISSTARLQQNPTVIRKKSHKQGMKVTALPLLVPQELTFRDTNVSSH